MCLKSVAAELIRGITISGLMHQLSWSTLKAQFDKPRLVAGSLVENLFNASIISKESLSELHKFITTFDETVSILESMQVPNLGDFILFSLAARC